VVFFLLLFNGFEQPGQFLFSFMPDKALKNVFLSRKTNVRGCFETGSLFCYYFIPKSILNYSIMYSTGEKIKVLRNVKGYTQEYMAKNLGVSQKIYSMIENDEKEVTQVILQKVAQVFNVTPEFIQNFSPTLVFNNNMSNNVIYVNQLIIQSEEKAVQAVKNIFAEMKATFGDTPPPKKPQKKASPKK
jgi:transcriptional regulator with XRE-family HTH domain